MKYLFGVLCCLMLCCVFVQYNDPDPFIWMLLYGFCALILGLAAFGIYTRNLLYAGYIIFGAGFIMLFPSVIEWISIEKGQNLMERMQNSKAYIEESRECLGLGLCILFISLIWIPIIKKRRSLQINSMQNTK